MFTTDGGILARILWRSTAAFSGALAFCLIAMAVDPREVEGVSAWLKPAKFALSFGVHLATLALIVVWTQASSRIFVVSIGLIVATAWVEFALIGLQAARGVRSHFNIETPFDSAVFTAMGIGVGVLFLASVMAALGLMLARSGHTWPAFVSSIAILAGALGSLTALAMVAPTEAQLAGFEQGVRLSSGARFPGGGVAEGAAIPVLGWNLERGDYRIAHFFGVHALQILLLWGWLIRHVAGFVRGAVFLTLVLANGAGVAILFAVASADIGLAHAPLWALAGAAITLAVQPAIAGLAFATLGRRRGKA